MKSPHIKADYHLPLLPGTNVPMINAFAHVIVSEGLLAEDYIKERCDLDSFEAWKAMILKPENSPEEVARVRALRLRTFAPQRGCTAKQTTALSTTASASRSTARGRRWSWAWPTSRWRPATSAATGVGVNPLRGQNNVQGSCDMGSFPHELAGYRPVQDDEVRGSFERHWGVDARSGAGLPHSEHVRCGLRRRTYKGMYIQGEDVAQSDPNTTHVEAALGAMECLVVQDLFLNETAKFAHVFLPGTSFLEKDGTFINAERRINRVRPVMKPRQGKDEWKITQELARATWLPDGLQRRRRNHGRDCRAHADVLGREFQIP